MDLLRIITAITIEQQPNKGYANRNRVINLDFVTQYSIVSGWEDLTNTASITLPKNIVAQDGNGGDFDLGQSINNQKNDTQYIGGSYEKQPLFMRGDKITIQAGYRYFNASQEEISDVPLLFTGYITKVNAKKPITIDCEDKMWKLKQVPVKPQTFAASKTLQQITKDLIAGAVSKGYLAEGEFTVSDVSDTLLKFDYSSLRLTTDMTMAQFLDKMRKEYKITTTLGGPDGNEIRFAPPLYNENESTTHKFKFQYNIIEDQLEFQRRDDINLSAVVRSAEQVASGGTTKDGKAKTRKKKLYVFLYSDGGEIKSKVVNSMDDIPPNTGGERHTFEYLTTDVDQLIKEGTAQLEKYFYSGYRGSFTAFGLPLVKWGDSVELIDEVLQDRNGIYKVKKVVYQGGIMGLRQEIHLHYAIKKPTV